MNNICDLNRHFLSKQYGNGHHHYNNQQFTIEFNNKKYIIPLSHFQQLAPIDLNVSDNSELYEHNKSVKKFTGVPIRIFFDLLSIPRNRLITIECMDSYKYTTMADLLIRNECILAFKVNDHDISFKDEGGPLRIIIPENTPFYHNKDVWCWKVEKFIIHPQPFEPRILCK